MEPPKINPKKSRGRPRKNCPISERKINIYAESLAQAQKWKKASSDSGMTISRFISEIIEDHLHAEGTGQGKKELEQKISSLEETIKKLRTESITMSKQMERDARLFERYESELKQLRQETWLQNGKFNGIRDFEQKLIQVLKEKGFVKEEEVLDLLHVSPTDSQTVKAIMTQLETLQDYNIIRQSKGGYKWIG